MPRLKALNSVPSPVFLQKSLRVVLLCQVAQYIITAAPIHNAEGESLGIVMRVRQVFDGINFLYLNNESIKE